MNFRKLTVLLLLCLYTIGVQAGDGQVDFIQNKNQFPQQVKFKADLSGGAVFLMENGFTYSYYKQEDLNRVHDLMHSSKDVENEKIHFHAYQVLFANANKGITISEDGLQPYYNNYFLGNDAGKWAGHVPIYKKVTLQNIYNNIDAVTYSKGSSLKYDFVVKPQGNAGQIMLNYKGVTPQIDKDGSLVIKSTVNTVIEQAPYAYQIIDGKEIAVACKFKKVGAGSITFDFPESYDKTATLIIDPILVFSTFSGSTAMTYGFSATYDLNGALYAGGECFDVGWPYSLGAFQTTFGGAVDAGINKYSANGTTRVYSTYYGGSNSDLPNNMMVNAADELVICGSTGSSNLPVSIGCYDNTANGGTDIYIARFSADGSQLKAATYLGGNGFDGSNLTSLSPNYGDINRGEVFTASNGNIFITNSSSSANFPVTGGAAQPTYGGVQDAVVCELDSNLSTLIYSTYLGGSAADAAFSLVLNSSNEVVICGGTLSTNFPTTAGSYKTTASGGTDGFVSIINTTTGLTHSSYLGTSSYDHAFKVQIDAADNIFVLGQTDYTSNYPVSAGAYAVANGDIFIHKLNPDLTASLVSTRMGNTGIGSTRFVPTAFMHDLCGNTYFSGFQASENSPVSANAYQTTPGSFWLGALAPDFTSLLYGTFFGPQGTHVDGGTSRFDPAGIIYHSACTADGSFPTTSTAVAPVKLTSSWDIASYKFDMEVGAVHADFKLANNANDTGCADYHVLFDNLSTGATHYNWDFGDGATSTAFNPDHTFTEGSHTIKLIASRETGCHLSDTASMDIYVKPKVQPELHLRDTFICDPGHVILKANISNPNNAYAYHWEPSSAILSDPNQENVTVNVDGNTDFTIYVSNSMVGECVDTAMGSVHISVNDYSNMAAIPLDTLICPGDTVLLRAFGGTHFLWSPDEKMETAKAASTLVWPLRDMIYSVKITSDSGCSIDRNVHLRMLPPAALNAGVDQDIKRGESAQILAQSHGPSYWMPEGIIVPGNILNPVVHPDQTTTYYLYSSSAEGCKTMDSVTIHVTNAMLPNAFSPNGDGSNDEFKLSIQDERVHLKDFSVYNRFGQRVFYTKEVQQGWNGFFNGKAADVGVYFYYVNYIIGVKTYNLKGDVTLIR